MGGGALHALFKSCDAVVVPSRNEPFGIVVLEAWSAGKPVVATNSGGPRDFVNPNVTGVLVVRRETETRLYIFVAVQEGKGSQSSNRESLLSLLGYRDRALLCRC